jgi:(4-(4-[2-(gamma-L-glutamylamino)ethyl]phenoxymethyl)furan-2-yl)methanamine synthase
MRAEAIIGWDLGGAHLKAARLSASRTVLDVLQLPCPLWQGMDRLYGALSEALGRLGPAKIHAVTMTGEMVDLFPTRTEGVTRLVQAMTERLAGASLRFFAGEGGFLEGPGAVANPSQVASANWLASAALVAESITAGLLVDVGSTTIDIVPVRAGQVGARGRDDSERLISGELVYSGVVRTPVMALAERVPFAGHWVPLVPEYFATSADVYRLTGELPEGADQHPAADGADKTVEASARRLARMIGRDADSAPLAAWRELAQWLARAQLQRLQDGCDQLLSLGVLPADAPIVGAGVGRFVAAKVAAHRGVGFVPFASLLEAPATLADRVSDCAPAVAVAWLAGRGEEEGERSEK